MTPRGLPRLDAAEYLGISPSKFSCLVREGILPVPRVIGAKKLWDRRDLDAFFETLPRDGDADADEWNDARAY